MDMHNRKQGSNIMVENVLLVQFNCKMVHGGNIINMAPNVGLDTKNLHEL